MKLLSPDFKNHDFMPTKYACDGQNINPYLEIYDTPSNAQSLAIIVTDPDAPKPNFVHWLIWNIDPKVVLIHENEVPANAVQGTNDFGNIHYDGPCPPSGVHQYIFELYALKLMLKLPRGATRTQLDVAMNENILDQCMLVGLYTKDANQRVQAQGANIGTGTHSNQEPKI